MDILFENKCIDTFREFSHQIKRVQESAESVVPDTNDDIVRIVSVQNCLLLKSKEMTSRGVSVCGEAQISILYVTENEESVACVKLNKSFCMDFDVHDLESEAMAHINLRTSNTETRIINPRKVSVTIEIVGELCCYCRECLEIESQPPENLSAGFHVCKENAEVIIPNAVCEKTFAVNEQFSFPSGKPAPSQIVSYKVDFVHGDIQQIGSKLILKGNIFYDVCYISEEVNYPVRTEFSTAFSQIIETGSENFDSCTLIIEPTSCYNDISDSISGEKLLNTELHALIQIVSRQKQKIAYISDAYSNLMPANCRTNKSQISSVSDMLRLKLNTDERINVVEDCADILSIFVDCSTLSAVGGKINATASLDIVYRSKSGTLSSARRTVNLEGECYASSLRIIKYRLCDMYLRPDGAFIDAHISLEIVYSSTTEHELARVCSVELSEEQAYDCLSFPSLNLVKADGESLWELAKQYHSSIEKITEMNEACIADGAKLMLIPKE